MRRKDMTFAERVAGCMVSMNQVAWRGRTAQNGYERLRLTEVRAWVEAQTQDGQPTCPHCGTILDSDTVAFDHVVPLCRGGRNVLANVAMICRRCNWYKGSMTGEEWGSFVDMLRATGRLEWFFGLFRPQKMRKLEMYTGNTPG